MKAGLHEMETLITYSAALGVTMPVVVNLGFLYDIQNCSGKCVYRTVVVSVYAACTTVVVSVYIICTTVVVSV